ncbi:MAG: alpha/beta fold hydrolase [Legionellaceae bacterium]
MKDKLHFVHGNGFPAMCYRQILKPLSEHFDCCFIDRVGHREAFPVTDNWEFLIQEVIMSIETQADAPVVALGHSLGGLLSVLAAIKAPHLFKCVIMLDAPLINRFQALVIRWSKQWGFIDRMTPAHRTRQRRTHWATREEAFLYLKRRALFKDFTELCLYDYIDYGMKKNEQGYSLRFDPRIELDIYRTIPHNTSQYEGLLRVPTVLIYGDHSHLIHQAERRYMEKHYGIQAIEAHGSHVFPFEYPTETFAFIMHALKGL